MLLKYSVQVIERLSVKDVKKYLECMMLHNHLLNGMEIWKMQVDIFKRYSGVIMELNVMETRWTELEKEAMNIINQHPFSNLRYGQALFNVLSESYPRVANIICGTMYDCFHDDTKVDAFKERVTDLWNSEIQ